MTKSLTRVAAASVALAMLAGCAQTKSWLSGRDSGGDDQTVILGAPEAEIYLDELYRLATGDPATQTEIFLDAESVAKLTPGPSAELRFALVLATPGHSESDPARAQSMLRELLIQTELLTPAEMSLAMIQLKHVEQQMVVESEANRLRSASSRQQQSAQQAVSTRLATTESENRRLKKELAEAEEKLEAITSIERSIREQE
jgi:hypothetical protein